MRSHDKYQSLTDGELCLFLGQVEEEYGIRVRVALVPLSRKSGKASHAVTATGYSKSGKRLADMDTAQVLFPGDTSKTWTGAAWYVAHQLVEIIDEYTARERREREQWEAGVLTPLEQYIAGSFES